MREELEYLGFDVGYGCWKPAASKMQPLQDMQTRDDPRRVCTTCGVSLAPAISTGAISIISRIHQPP